MLSGIFNSLMKQCNMCSLFKVELCFFVRVRDPGEVTNLNTTKTCQHQTWPSTPPKLDGQRALAVKCALTNGDDKKYV